VEHVDVYCPQDAVAEMLAPRRYAFKLVPCELWKEPQAPKPLSGWQCIRQPDGSFIYVHRGLERAAMASSGLL
jgi:hypothetical protein